MTTRSRLAVSVSLAVAAILVAPAIASAGTTWSVMTINPQLDSGNVRPASFGNPVTFNGVTKPLVAFQVGDGLGDFGLMAYHDGISAATGHMTTIVTPTAGFFLRGHPVVIDDYVFWADLDPVDTGSYDVYRWDLRSGETTIVWSQTGMTRPDELNANEASGCVDWAGTRFGMEYTMHSMPATDPSQVTTVASFNYQPITQFVQAGTRSAWIWAPGNLVGTDTYNVYTATSPSLDPSVALSSYVGDGVDNEPFGARMVTADRDWVVWEPKPASVSRPSTMLYDAFTGVATTLAPAWFAAAGEARISGSHVAFIGETTSGAQQRIAVASTFTNVGTALPASAQIAPREPFILGNTVCYNDVDASGAPVVKLATRRVAADRVPGGDRYSVAAAAAARSYPDGWAGVTTVVIASGLDRAAADPLAAGGLCWKYDAPLLLTDYTKLPTPTSRTLKAIASANPGNVHVIVVGGPGSVPASRISDLKAIVGATHVERLLSSGTRYDMAAKIAERMKNGPGGRSFPASPTALIANGADAGLFLEALALSAISRRNGYPLLLVSSTSPQSATTYSLHNVVRPDRVIVAGDTFDVSTGVYTAVGGTDRWQGLTIDSTIGKIADNAVALRWLPPTNPGIAAKVSDALAGGTACGRLGGPILATPSTALGGPALVWTTHNKLDIDSFSVYGGTLSVAPGVVTAINASLAQ